MTTERFVSLLAVVLAASYASWGLNALEPVQPVVRRGLQVAIMGAAALWVFRVLQAM